LYSDEDYDEDFYEDYYEDPEIVTLADGYDWEGVMNLLDDDPGLINHRSQYPDQTLLMVAVLARRVDVVEMLVRRGADVDKVDEQGCTALHHAVRVKSEEMVELLLTAGADTAWGDAATGSTALMMAVQADCVCMVRRMVPRMGREGWIMRMTRGRRPSTTPAVWGVWRWYACCWWGGQIAASRMTKGGRHGRRRQWRGMPPLSRCLRCVKGFRRQEGRAGCISRSCIPSVVVCQWSIGPPFATSLLMGTRATTTPQTPHPLIFAVHAWVYIYKIGVVSDSPSTQVSALNRP
jgi:hypothetical protein